MVRSLSRRSTAISSMPGSSPGPPFGVADLSLRYIEPIYLTAIMPRASTRRRRARLGPRRPASPAYNGRAVRGITDYTLAKRAVIAEFRRGGLTRLDICDAHPELLRAARNIRRPLPPPPPVCRCSTLPEAPH